MTPGTFYYSRFNIDDLLLGYASTKTKPVRSRRHQGRCRVLPHQVRVRRSTRRALLQGPRSFRYSLRADDMDLRQRARRLDRARAWLRGGYACAIETKRNYAHRG